MNDHAVRPGGQAPQAQRRQAGAGRRDDPAAAASMLNRVVAMSRMMTLRCQREYHTALRLHSPPLAAAALEHANEASAHVHRIRERIRELGGEVEPPTAVSLPLQQSELRAANPLAAVIADDLSSARAAVAGYREVADFFAGMDPSTSRMLEQIIQGENERADDLAELLAEASSRRGH